MSSKKTKKEYIRRLIIAGANEYKNHFAGKCFMYVYGEEYFEVVFETKQFKHLTGIESFVGAKDFYKYAKLGILTEKQFGFSARHPYQTAKEKLCSFPDLPKLTTDMVCMLKDFNTLTITYKIGITNLKFTLGLIEKDKCSNIFIPQTLRINDKAIENSKDSEFVNFILVKNGTIGKYTDISYADKGATFPSVLMPYISNKLKSQMFEEGYISETLESKEDLSTILNKAYEVSNSSKSMSNKPKELINSKE